MLIIIALWVLFLAGMGCFWGAERKFWRQRGVYSTQVGYAGGHTVNPTYEEVCSGRPVCFIDCEPWTILKLKKKS